MAECSTCNDLCLKALISGYRRKDFDFEELAATVEAGCPSCKIIYDGISARMGSVADVSRVALNSFGKLQTLHVTVWGRERPDCEVFEFYTLQGGLVPEICLHHKFDARLTTSQIRRLRGPLLVLLDISHKILPLKNVLNWPILGSMTVGGITHAAQNMAHYPHVFLNSTETTIRFTCWSQRGE